MSKFPTVFQIRALSAFLALNVFLPTAATADALHECKRAKEANEKLRYCSQAIAQTRYPKLLERLYLRRGNAYLELKLYPEAKKDFTSLIAINPHIAGYFDNRMFASQQMGQMQDALADANREVALAPKTAFVHRSRGLLFENMMDYQRALQDFEEATAIDPANTGLIIDKARLKAKSGRAAEAILDLNAVIAREPANLSAYRERGFAYLLIGDSANAEQDLEFFAKTAPNDEEVQSTLAIVRARRSVGDPSSGMGPN